MPLFCWNVRSWRRLLVWRREECWTGVALDRLSGIDLNNCVVILLLNKSCQEHNSMLIDVQYSSLRFNNSPPAAGARKMSNGETISGRYRAYSLVWADLSVIVILMFLLPADKVGTSSLGSKKRIPYDRESADHIAFSWDIQASKSYFGTRASLLFKNSGFVALFRVW